MPNWMYNEVTIFGDDNDLATIEALVKSDESEFDFEKIIPMPKDLNIDANPEEKTALVIYCDKNNLEIPKAAYESIPFFFEEEARKDAEEISQDTAYYNYGRQVYHNLVTYGVSNWYRWRCHNWGTKWNASDVIFKKKRNRLIYSFDTAWSFPFNIFLALSKKFPKVKIRVDYDSVESGISGYYEVKDRKQLIFLPNTKEE